VNALTSLLATQVRVSDALPYLSTDPRRPGWIHYLLLPGDPMWITPDVVVLSPLAHWLLEYDKANRLMRSKARWWFR
jgi:hypothetical protein